MHRTERKHVPTAIQTKPTRYAVHCTADGEAVYVGIDRGGSGRVIAENAEVMVIKWAGGKHWVGRGVPQAYHHPRTDVLRKDEDGRFTLLISWENDRKQHSP